MRRAVMTLAAVAIATAALGCDEKLEDVTGPTPNLTTTFSSIQQEVFSTQDSSGRAACTGCHNAARARFNGNLNLDPGAAYGQLVGVAANGKAGAIRVIPGDAANSYLVHKLEGTSGIVGSRMPRTGGPYLTPGQMLVIRRWINQGAPNN